MADMGETPRANGREMGESHTHESGSRRSRAELAGPTTPVEMPYHDWHLDQISGEGGI
jgi:hypothetical protein